MSLRDRDPGPPDRLSRPKSADATESASVSPILSAIVSGPRAAERTTVIIPTFNRCAYLMDALESLFAQTLAPGEIIVVDDGSTDDTASRVAELGAKVRYVHKSNTGKSDSLNVALRLARHPLIWIVDDDDVAKPTALATLSSLLHGRPDLGFAYGRYERFKTDPATGAVRTRDGGYWRDVDNDDFLTATLEDFFVHHPGLLVRRSAYEAVGEFSNLYSEDYDMLVRLADRFDCAKTDEVVFLQREHAGVRRLGLAASARAGRWMDDQRELMSSLRRTLPIDAYLPRSRRTPGLLSPSDRRQALIARAVVMARKKLWPEAFEDFHAACAIEDAPDVLSDDERHCVRRALFSKYGAPEILTDPSVAAGIERLADDGPVGRDIAHAFGRSLVWFVRTRLQAGQLGDAARFGALAVRLSGAPRLLRAS